MRPSGDGVDGPDGRPVPGLLLPFLWFRLWEGSWPVSSTLRPAVDESVESTSPNELLDLVLELDAFLRVVAVVAMVEAELVRIALPGVCAHPLWSRELLSNFHQYLDFRCVEGGIVAKSSWGRAPPSPTIRASLPAYPGRSLDTLVSGRSSRMWPSFSWPFFDCGLTRVSRLSLSRGLLIHHPEGFFRSDIPFGPSQQVSKISEVLFLQREQKVVLLKAAFQSGHCY